MGERAQDERLKAALRENLKRRKAQARARAEASRTARPGAEGDPGAEEMDRSPKSRV